MSKHIVDRVEDYMDRSEILCTTYQMRNFYLQFRDGYFGALDVMNYIQHEIAVRMCKSEDNVLDICCGRGLMLPMLRYQRKDINMYVGVDIEPRNAVFKDKRVHDGKPVPFDWYPFKVHYVQSDVAVMDEKLPEGWFDTLIYTSSLEHMHPDHGLKSLAAARTVAKDGATMFLTCPNTPEDQDGYDTQYRAHVYEWKRSEVVDGLNETGWQVQEVFGLLINKTDVPEHADVLAKMSRHIPYHWLNTAFAAMFPEHSKELAYIATAV